MNWWSTLSPGQIFFGVLLVGLGLMILFWHQLFPDRAASRPLVESPTLTEPQRGRVDLTTPPKSP
jgi:hypothetical protein